MATKQRNRTTTYDSVLGFFFSMVFSVLWVLAGTTSLRRSSAIGAFII